MRHGRRLASVVLALSMLSVAACSGSDDGGGSDAASDTTAAEATTTTVADEPLTILVTNDDGYSAEGIDLIAQTLAAEPNVEVVVVAPAENQSGTGDQTTAGDLVTAEVQTASGIEATSVAGFPADSVVVALDELGIEPDLVVSGINEGQNIGPLAGISGTVGAAKQAVRRGIPALAVSQGISEDLDYESAVDLAIDWFREHRDEFGDDAATPTTLTNINVPTCETGSVRGPVETSTAADLAGRSAVTSNCESTVAPSTFADDVDAFINGCASIAPVSAN